MLWAVILSERHRRCRRLVGKHLGLSENEVDERHQWSPLRYRIFEEVSGRCQDPDVDMLKWLLEGAPAGYAASVPPGPWFPKQHVEDEELEHVKLHGAARNHPSFYETHGEGEAPGSRQALYLVNVGHAELFKSREEAEALFGECIIAPLGNIRKPLKSGKGFKDRIIMDLKWSHANLLARLWERVVLPRGGPSFA